MTKTVANLLFIALLAAAAASLSACGDDGGPTMERPPDPRLKYKKKVTGPDMAALVTVDIKNPKWDIIKSHFTKVLSQKHVSAHDVFRPKVLKLIPRPTLPEQETTDTVEAVEVVEEVRGPLQLYPLPEYELLLVMSGTAVPKALVLDPKGQTHVVTRDTRLGDAGGIVESVTQYMVVVKEPSAERPSKLMIRPPFIDLTTKLTTSVEERSEPAPAAATPTHAVPEPAPMPAAGMPAREP